MFTKKILLTAKRCECISHGCTSIVALDAVNTDQFRAQAETSTTVRRAAVRDPGVSLGIIGHQLRPSRTSQDYDTEAF